MVLLIGLLVFVDFGYVLFDASFFELKFANWAFRFCRVFLGDLIVINHEKLDEIIFESVNILSSISRSGIYDPK